MYRRYYIAPPRPQGSALAVLTIPTIGGRMAATLADVTMDAVGLVTIKGTIAQTLDNVAMASASRIAIAGTIARTLDNVTSSMTGSIAASFSAALGTGGPIGSLAIAAAPLSGNALSGAVGQAVGTGVINVTLDAVTMFATGDVDEKNARIAATLDDVTMAASGTLTAGSDGVWFNIVPPTDIWTPIAPDDDIWIPIDPDDDTWSAAA